jgi:uncharacterized OB-fold protein
VTVGPVQRDAATAAWFDGTARHEFLLRACPAGHLATPQAEQCPDCGATDLGWGAASGDAVLVSWAVVHGRPTDDGPPPTTTVAIAELAEGPWWWSQLVGDVDPATLRAGQPLRVGYERAGGDAEWIPVFAVTDGSTGAPDGGGRPPPGRALGDEVPTPTNR